LERKFQNPFHRIYFAQVEKKSSANEGCHLPGSNAPSFIEIQAEVMVVRRPKEGLEKD
jgi:hypothetical protein